MKTNRFFPYQMTTKLAVLMVSILLLLVALLPLMEIISRAVFSQGIPGSIHYVRHATLWVGFIGAVLASLDNRHISLGVSSWLKGETKHQCENLANLVAMIVCALMVYASWDMVKAELISDVLLGGIIPLWVAQSVMPVCFLAIALHYLIQLIKHSSWVVLLAGGLISLFYFSFIDTSSNLFLPIGLVLVFIATLAGTPVFIVLGSMAALLFASEQVPLAAISVEAYRIAANPILPTIPLFTLAGTILASSNASARLVKLFDAWFGWMPGGSAVAAICVCGFFTTFTGGSGVTILALGGLMLPVLLKQGYKESFSLGLLTSSGSLGILLPPSLLIILYGVASHTPIDNLFIAGILPGLLLISLVCGFAIYKSCQNKTETNKISRSKFNITIALRTLYESKWEVLLPVIVLYGIFSGTATLVEVAAVAAGYTLITEFLIHRDLNFRTDLLKVLKECATMVGGIMIIIASAMGLTSYLIYADIPILAADWIQSVTQSPIVFLLALNVFLLIAGCLLDIFSAIVVVVPLILPVAASFGIDPIHLGIIFLANMELGYLTPPVGMNLYLASYRFDKPLMQVFKACIPFFLINVFAVLLITFVPEISVGVVQWFKG